MAAVVGVTRPAETRSAVIQGTYALKPIDSVRLQALLPERRLDRMNEDELAPSARNRDGGPRTERRESRIFETR